MPEIRRANRRLRWLGVFVLILSLFTVVQTYVSFREQHQQQQCLEQVVHDLTDALDARSDLTNRDNMAQNELIFAVFNADSREESRAAFAKYTREQNQINEDRKAHPIPAYPQGRCNE